MAVAVQLHTSEVIAATGREIMTGMKVLQWLGFASHTLRAVVPPSTTSTRLYKIGRQWSGAADSYAPHKEGVIGLNKTRVTPPAPQRIAIYCFEGAAGYGGFYKIIFLAIERNSASHPVLIPQ